MATDNKASGVRAVERAIDILQSFSADHPSMSVVELQNRVHLSRPTLYRLLHTLVQKGFVTADGDPQRFSLGYGVMQLAHVWMSEFDVTKIARPIIERLREETGETAALFVLRNHLRLCVLEAPSRHVLSITRGAGETEHISKGASGKAILAFLDKELRQTLLEDLPRGVKRPKLLGQLSRARQDGFAISRSEVFVGAIAMAAPVFDHVGQVMGSVGLFGPSARVTEEKIATYTGLVKSAADRLSRDLGYQKKPLKAESKAATRRPTAEAIPRPRKSKSSS